MPLSHLYRQLADVFDGSQTIEKAARDALLAAEPQEDERSDFKPLTAPFLDVMSEPDALPVCQLIAQLQFDWAPPGTSDSALYIEHSVPKVHVELVGPMGLAKSNEVRLGLYGMLPNSEYGIRTHLAEETYIMLAGQVMWKRGTQPYLLHKPGERSYHPSMLEHANRTTDKAFMSVYVWHGDISTESYSYAGIPTE